MYEQIKNIVIDTNYTNIIENGWFPNINFSNTNVNSWEKKKWLFDKFIDNLVPKKWDSTTINTENTQATWNGQTTTQTTQTPWDNTQNTGPQKKWFFDNFIDNLIPKKWNSTTTNTESTQTTWNEQSTTQTTQTQANNSENTGTEQKT